VSTLTAELVAKYSEFINFPIYLWSSKEVEEEVAVETTEEEEEDDTAEAADDDEDEDDASVEDEEEEEEDDGGGAVQVVNPVDPLVCEKRLVWFLQPSRMYEVRKTGFSKFAFSQTGQLAPPYALSRRRRRRR
jgi:heat shock protein beta